MLTRPIPSTGEPLPVIGLGTWQTFDTGTSARERQPLGQVLDRFAAAGGRLIDSSPMYGRAEEVVGALKGRVAGAFIATKVWTRGRENGIAQMRRSAKLLQSGVIDLMQIHNMLDWETHLETLREWKAEGRIRYLGITHYTRSAFGDLEEIMRSETLDFVQLPLSVELPDAEERLLPLAESRRIAVLVNRPFEEGALLRRVAATPLPEWANELGAESWSELFLRYIVSHPAVTCVIPATSDPAHMEENLRAGEGRMLTGEERVELRRKVTGDSYL
jgi:diketogulonate reductase-like aldo/keto reductase